MTEIGITLLHFDVWLNCLLLALMFRYNDGYYKKLCHCCIWCCFRNCHKTFNKNDKTELLSQRERISRYLELNGGFRVKSKSSIVITAPPSTTDINCENRESYASGVSIRFHPTLNRGILDECVSGNCNDTNDDVIANGGDGGCNNGTAANRVNMAMNLGFDGNKIGNGERKDSELNG